MTNEHDSSQPSPPSSFAEEKSASSSYSGHRFAEQLDEDEFIYLMFGLLDGVNLSYTTLRLFFDWTYVSSWASADAMHEWMVTPEGMFLAALESVAIIALSFISNTVSKKDPDWMQQLGDLWPYCRDVMKGLKNAYKGIRSSLQAFSVYTGVNFRTLIAPLGIVFGILAALNRIWLRYVLYEPRKTKQKSNGHLLSELQELISLTPDQAQMQREKIQCAKGLQTEHYWGYFGAAFGGVIDGLYLYMGVIGVVALTPQLLTLVLGCSVIFYVACVITRVYEEYEYQRQLACSESKAELMILGKELVWLFNELQTLSINLAQPSPPNLETLKNKQKSFDGLLSAKMSTFKAQREELRRQLILPPHLAMLSGLRNGLAAYSAITSFLFALSTLSSLVIAPFPPIVLMGGVILGMVALLGFMIHCVYLHLSQEQHIEKKEKENDKLSSLLQKIKQCQEDMLVLKPTPVEIEDAIDGGMYIGASFPRYFDALDVFRALFSGVSKGPRAIDYTFNPFLERDEQGHYHDTPMMVCAGVVSSILYAVVLSLRTYARAFSNPAPGQDVKLRPPPPSPKTQFGWSSFFSKAPTPESVTSALRLHAQVA